jgi:hypothetical protein
VRIYALLTNRHYTIMSLLTSIIKLSCATVNLARQDVNFRKDLAISTATLPIYAAKKAIDVVDNATKTTERTNKVRKAVRQEVNSIDELSREILTDLGVEFVK